MNCLPLDMIKLIIEQLTLPDVIKFSVINRDYYEIAKNYFDIKTKQYIKSMIKKHQTYEITLDYVISINNLKLFTILLEWGEKQRLQLYSYIKTITNNDIDYVKKMYQNINKYPEKHFNIIKNHIIEYQLRNPQKIKEHMYRIHNPETKRKSVINECTYNAIKYKSYEIIKWLLRNHNNEIEIIKLGMDLAGKRIQLINIQDSKIIKIILKYKKFDFTKHDLVNACECGNLYLLKIIIKQGIDPSYDGNKALLLACHFGRLEIVEYLLTLDCVDPSERNNEVIIRASINNYGEIVKLLYQDERVKNKLKTNNIVDQNRVISFL